MNKNYLSVENMNDSKFLFPEEKKEALKNTIPQTCFHCFVK